MIEKIFEDIFDSVDEFKEETIQELTEEYEELQDELLFWLILFSTNGKLDWAEMRKTLTTSQLNRLKQYIGDEIEERVRIKRIDAINLILEKKLEEIAEIHAEKMKNFSTEIYEKTYYKTAYNTQNENNAYLVIPALIVGDLLKKVLIPWTPDEINFINRIKINSNKLLNMMKQSITEDILAGEEPEAIKKELAKKVRTMINSVKALINTELTRIISIGAYESMKANGIKYYQLKAVLDNRTSEICLGMNGKVFPITEFEIGVTASPFHTHCRTIEVPYGEPSKTGEPDDVASYEDWYKKYVQ